MTSARSATLQRKKHRWIVRFSENGEEYIGSLLVVAHKLHRVSGDANAFIADGVRVRIDEHITEIERL